MNVNTAANMEYERDDDNVIDEETSRLLEESGKAYADQKVPETTQEISDFMEKNRKLIHAIIKPYRGLDAYDDLYQEAALGFFITFAAKDRKA